DVLYVGTSPFFISRRVQLTQLAARHAVPAIYSVRQYTEAGGLMSYGTSLTDAKPRHLHIDPAAGRPARHHCGYIVFRRKRGTRRLGFSVLGADDISVSRVRDGRGPDELRRQR